MKNFKIFCFILNFAIFFKNRVSLIEMIFKVSERLHLSQNTMQMAVSFLDFVVIKGYIPSSQYQIYAITGIMLAGAILIKKKIFNYFFFKNKIAKAIELDKRIPFVSSLRKCAIEDFKPSEIKKTEEIMLEILGWNTQFATLIDLIEYFLSQGIIFSNDLINFDRKADFKEINLGLKLQKQDSLNEKTQRFASRVEKSKSLIEKNTSFESNCKNIKNEKENIMKKEENVKEVKHLSEKERWDLVLKIETELRTLSNLIIKG